MQSGMKRKTFKVPNAGINDLRGRHVTGIAVDALNRNVVVSTLKGAIHVRWIRRKYRFRSARP
jgi:U3 small nucleolar RNA-associated protein 21